MTMYIAAYDVESGECLPGVRRLGALSMESRAMAMARL